MNTTYSSQRALVLGGGGALGNAWEIGVIAGLFDAGLDVTDAELIVGTSAGSTAAAQISGPARPDELFAAALVAPAGPGGARRPSRPVSDHLTASAAIIAASRDAADMRRRMGAAALEADEKSDGSAHERWRAVVAARLPGPDWPEQRVLITAVDARTGERVAFDRHSGVDLADAVAASCSGPGAPAHRIGDGRYVDGGFQSNENADLAAGFGRVLVLTPFGGRTRQPLEWGNHLAAQAEALQAGGSRVETIAPDSAAREVFGNSMMDLSARPAAARAGHDQGRSLAGRLAGFWRVSG